VRHVAVEEWSRRPNALARRDARVKLILLLVALALIGMSPPGLAACYGAGFVVAAAGLGLPAGGLVLRAAAVLPFSAVFAVLSLLGGAPERALNLVVRSTVSALALLLVVATTPLPSLLAGLERMGVPRLLILVIQFLYRYLFVVVEQAVRMRLAARCRGGARGRLGFSAAAGALAVLFGRSAARAESVQRAMLARGFAGHIPVLAEARMDSCDAAFLALGAVVLLGSRWAWAVLG
jgi:cobalt/nickel transport system permease protein